MQNGPISGLAKIVIFEPIHSCFPPLVPALRADDLKFIVSVIERDVISEIMPEGHVMATVEPEFSAFELA